MRFAALLAAASLALTLTNPLEAQIRKASASPRSQVTQELGLATVTLDYGRPGVKGRPIFGGLEPFGKVWRTGANASTKISFDRAVQFGGEDVPAGTYGLYTIPEAKSWTVILHKNAGLWGAGGYDPANDLLRVTAKVEPLADLVETFRIDFQGFHANGADLVIAWEKTRVRVPIFVDTDAQVFAEIDEKVREAEGEVSAQSYFDAAMFYFEKGRDLEQAAEWADKAIERAPTAFWMVYFRGEIALALDDPKAARTHAKKAREMASQSRAGDFGYIAKSDLLLERIAAARKR